MQEVEYVYNKISLDLSVWYILKMYFVLLALFLTCMTIYQEGFTKGTSLNRSIRHYFGLNTFVEYTAERPDLITHDYDGVSICDYRTMTPKMFFNDFVSKYRPCLFKDYGKTWPAYEKWKNESYLKETSGNEVIYAERQ